MGQKETKNSNAEHIRSEVKSATAWTWLSIAVLVTNSLWINRAWLTWAALVGVIGGAYWWKQAKDKQEKLGND